MTDGASIDNLVAQLSGALRSMVNDAGVIPGTVFAEWLTEDPAGVAAFHAYARELLEVDADTAAAVIRRFGELVIFAGPVLRDLSAL